MPDRKRLYDHPRSAQAVNEKGETEEEFYRDLEEPTPAEKRQREREVKQYQDDVEKGRIKPDVIDVDTPAGKEKLKRRMRDIEGSKRKDG